MPDVSLRAQLACARRELALRSVCAHVPVLVARGLLQLCGHTHDVFRYTLLACPPAPEAES